MIQCLRICLAFFSFFALNYLQHTQVKSVCANAAFVGCFDFKIQKLVHHNVSIRVEEEEREKSIPSLRVCLCKALLPFLFLQAINLPLLDKKKKKLLARKWCMKV